MKILFRFFLVLIFLCTPNHLFSQKKMINNQLPIFLYSEAFDFILLGWYIPDDEEARINKVKKYNRYSGNSSKYIRYMDSLDFYIKSIPKEYFNNYYYECYDSTGFVYETGQETPLVTIKKDIEANCLISHCHSWPFNDTVKFDNIGNPYYKGKSCHVEYDQNNFPIAFKCSKNDSLYLTIEYQYETINDTLIIKEIRNKTPDRTFKYNKSNQIVELQGKNNKTTYCYDGNFLTIQQSESYYPEGIYRTYHFFQFDYKEGNRKKKYIISEYVFIYFEDIDFMAKYYRYLENGLLSEIIGIRTTYGEKWIDSYEKIIYEYFP